MLTQAELSGRSSVEVKWIHAACAMRYMCVGVHMSLCMCVCVCVCVCVVVVARAETEGLAGEVEAQMVKS